MVSFNTNFKYNHVLAECTFEDPNLCGWTNMIGDDFDWTRDNSGTSSSGTGPLNDNTFGTPAGSYTNIDVINLDVDCKKILNNRYFCIFIYNCKEFSIS